jgi:hypothetical protein
MAITNHERVGKALELLTAGLQPFVERELSPGSAGVPPASPDKSRPEAGAPRAAETAALPGVSPPKRFHGTATLDSKRVGRDAGRIADEVVAHLSGIVGANVKVTLEIEADIPSGAPDHVVRTVTENCRTLKFDSQGFEKE